MGKQCKGEKNPAKQLTNTSTIDYDKLADAIVRAHHKLVDEEKTEQQKAEEHWKKCIGMDKCKNNVLRAAIRMLFFKKKDVQSARTTMILVRSLLSGIIGLVKLVLYAVALIFICACVIVFFIDIGTLDLIALLPMFIVSAILAFVIAQIMRIVVLEIDNIKDNKTVISLFSVVTSFAALIIAIVALFIK